MGTITTKTGITSGQEERYEATQPFLYKLPLPKLDSLLPEDGNSTFL
jgi:hypothetical protein